VVLPWVTIHRDSDSDRLSIRISSCHVDSASLAISILEERNSHYNTANSDVLRRPINSIIEYDFTCQAVLFTLILIWHNKNLPMLLIKSYHLFVASVICSLDDNRKNSSWHAISQYSLRISKILLLKIFFIFWQNNVRLHVEC